MASTLQPSTFQVKIKEEHVIKNVRTINETFYRVGNVTNVDRRIVTCPETTSINLVDFNGLNPGAGTFPSSSIKYARITNLDNSQSLAVTFENSNGDYWTQNLTPTASLMWASSEVTGSQFDGGFSGSALVSVDVFAVSASIDVEYVLVNA
jgi:hypothetical protein|tara:strand:- start:100 stop:552 length:453 start_codon:yes stop_codon:yes gene_type:complete